MQTTSLLSRPLLDLLFFASVQHQLVWVLRCHPGMALVPIVGNGVRKDVPGAIESRACDRSWGSVEC